MMMASHMEANSHLNYSISTIASWKWPGEAAEDGTSNCGPAIDVGEMDRAPGFKLALP